MSEMKFLPPVDLPGTTSHRWQPVRGGLLNLYRYDSQEFRYENGRLVLRGNNGTGKSRVLALQLPFLLDGEIIPQRVEPDGDPAKRMEWNLLMGGKHDDRIGYTWLEFGRVDEHGIEHFQTVGCGLRAVQGKGLAQQWLFITRQRIGRDLFLANEHFQPLVKTRLEELIAGHGQFFGSGRVEEDRREYRKAVDALFFRLGARYESLLSLLIQLRQPQLTRKLEEKTLSDALNQSLPPLPDSVLGDVAEAFRTLENDRKELGDLTAARDGSEAFLAEYQRYIRIAARRRAEEVRKANSEYESTMRRLRELEGGQREESERLVSLDQHIEWLKGEKATADSKVRTLQDSPEMKSARDLETARDFADRTGKRAATAETELQQREAALAKEREHHAAAEEEDRRAVEAVSARRAASEECSGACELLDRHRENLGGDDSSIETGDAALNRLIDRRLEAVRHIEKHNRAISEASQKVTLAQSTHDRANTEFEESLEQEKAALSFRDEAIASLFSSYKGWSANLTELEVPPPGDFEEDFHLWHETAEGESPLAAAVKRAGREADQRLAKLRADAERDLTDQTGLLEKLEQDRRRLIEGVEQPPPVPHSRDAGIRDGRSGAPFWALCDFRPEVSESEKAALEAALEASGLLDAWVTPDGEILHSAGHDTLLLPGTNSAAPLGRSLAEVLQPDPQREATVADAAISAVLLHIGFGEAAGETWVDRKGNWQLGPLHGSWNKPASQYIGHASREAERQRLLRQVESDISEMQIRIRWLRDALAVLEERQRMAGNESASAPSDSAVRQSISAIDVARHAVAAKRTRLSETERLLQETRKRHNDAIAVRDQEAADLSIASWTERLQDLRELLGLYRQSLTELKAATTARRSTFKQLSRAGENLASTIRLHEEATAKHREAREEAFAAEEKARTLEASVGATVEEIMAKLGAAKSTADVIGKNLIDHTDKRTASKTSLAVIASRISDTNRELEEKSLLREGAVTGLIGFAETGQLRVAHPDLAVVATGSWSPSRGVEVARQIESLLSTVEHDDAAWKRNQSNIHHHFETLQTSLRSHGYMPEGTLQNDIYVVSIPFQGKSCTIDELHDALIGIIHDRQELLDAREREVLENYLIDEVAESLHDHLHNALRWKEEANAELESRPMDTGMTLRFYWEPAPDGPPALAEARKLLLGTRGTWSPAERKAVGEFLQQQIQAVRAANDTGTWQDHLTLAFDYRKWHQFGVERRQDGIWKRLTKRTHGTGSGGEKAVALTVPQLAAAAAHYKSAHPLAPRLILLDEAFVGVDADMRAKCFGMIAAFDLDVVITSENEWACYPTVPAIAIYQLSARPGIDAVHASRWVWNGRNKTRDETPQPPAIPPAPEP